MVSKYDDIFYKVKNSVEKTSSKIDELDNPLRKIQMDLEKKCADLYKTIEDGEADSEVFDEYNNTLSYLNAIIDQRKNLTESEIKNSKLYVDTLKILSSVEKTSDDSVSNNEGSFLSLDSVKEKLKRSVK